MESRVRSEVASELRPAQDSVLKQEQGLQEQEYLLPYHYVTQFGGQFRHSFVDSWGINYAATMEFMLARLDCAPSSRVVDIGCGDGRFSREIAASFPQAEVVGLDYSARAVGLAKAMNRDVGNLEFRAVDIVAEKGLGTFDLAILMEVFEHVPLAAADAFMGAVSDLLAPGGVLHLTVPHSNKPLEYKHFQHFTIATLRKYVEPHLEIIEVIPFEKRGWRRTVLETILCNRLFALNNDRLLNIMYRWHSRRMFVCEGEGDCQRIYLCARKR